MSQLSLTFKSIIRKQKMTRWLWEIRCVKCCEITNRELLIAIYIKHFLYFLLVLHVRIFNRRYDSESHGAYQQWNNCFKRHSKADNPKFYLHVFCLLYGLDASLDLPLMLLASKLLWCKRSLPLPFLPPAVWLFEAVLCFQSAHHNVSLHITQAFRFFQLCVAVRFMRMLLGL